MEQREGTELPAEVVQQVQPLNLADELLAWFDEVYYAISAERGQQFKELVERVRQVDRPLSGTIISRMDIDAIKSIWPNTALRLEAELKRLQALVEMKDGA